MQAAEALEEGLEAFDGTVLAVTHDRWFARGFDRFLVYGADGWAFLDPRFVDGGDLASFLLKTVLCGIYVPLAAAWRGLGARGGSAAVGQATTEGVVAAVLGCLVIDLVVAFAFLILGA